MKAFINGDKFVGTPEEIATLVKRLAMAHPVPTVMHTQTSPKTLGPKASYVAQGLSEELRRKLADDPNYNPYGGVVPSKEILVAKEAQREIQRKYGADIDPGITYED